MSAPPEQTSLKLLAVPSSYAFAGDSHAAIFEGLVFHNEGAQEPADRYLLTKGRWQSYFRAARFFRDERLDEWFTRTLRDLRFLRDATEDALPIFPPHRTHAQAGPAEERYAPAKPAQRVLVVSCGDVDCREATHAIGPGADIEIDPPYDPIEALPPFTALQIVSTEEIASIVRSRYLEPLFAGLRALRAAGYTKLFLYALPPPPVRDLPHFKPARLRYKMNVLFNRLYEEFCRESGVRLLSIWDEVTVNGLRDERYDLDSVHLNGAAAEIAVNKLHALLRSSAEQR